MEFVCRLLSFYNYFIGFMLIELIITISLLLGWEVYSLPLPQYFNRY